MRLTIAIGVTALLVVALVAYEIALWRECIPNHPWWYCIRVLIR